MKLVSLYQRLLVSEKKREEEISRKVPRYKGTFYPTLWAVRPPPQNLAKQS